MKVICAWCGKALGEKDGQGEAGVSHGMCRECADMVMAGTWKGPGKPQPGSKAPAKE